MRGYQNKNTIKKSNVILDKVQDRVCIVFCFRDPALMLG